MNRGAGRDGEVNDMALKTAEERIDSMEKTIKLYRILVILLFALLAIIMRDQLVGWLDGVEGWISNIFSAGR